MKQVVVAPSNLKVYKVATTASRMPLDPSKHKWKTRVQHLRVLPPFAPCVQMGPNSPLLGYPLRTTPFRWR